MLRVQDFMSENVQTIEADTPAEVAYDKMYTNKIHHLVVRKNGKPAGILSSHDLGGKEQQSANVGKKVADLMTPQIVHTEPHASLRQVANMMRGRAIGCLPVFDDERLVGIITISDLLELIGRGVQRPAPKGERPPLRRQLDRKWAAHTHGR